MIEQGLSYTLRPFFLEPVDDLYAAALKCNRDEFEGLVRSLHRGASKSQCEEIPRFHSNA
jgi:hypothetical protein